MKKFLLFLLLFITNIFAVDFANDTLYKADINSKTAYEMQKNKAILIDVRTKAEFKQSHPKGAINIPIFFAQNNQRVFNKKFVYDVYNKVNQNQSKKIILICRSGSRTKLASNLLAHNGFTDVYNIKNGFAYDWSKTNLPIEK
ncbi:hypothetical protein CP960_08490 [Malaciobacter halophilus]|uniref:Rhodanese domain-containing protein n=1 Tax=Malaciobacter halophilus TaxID=197482 RepID=A0A2N1J1Z9_9BACT|nr:rhodanese-like domain-containing protein [Malaciobacter halophilus]AXH10093.1 rhodanese-like domain-containing protein [Malaciobacter halophilus]PKI80578.1 hypothetical protein CP960_08490 [Malaciobacter halophilus]